MSPIASDFEAVKNGYSIRVRFKPSDSLFTFSVLQGGDISTVPNIRHRISGDTGHYQESEVLEMARKVAMDLI